LAGAVRAARAEIERRLDGSRRFRFPGRYRRYAPARPRREPQAIPACASRPCGSQTKTPNPNQNPLQFTSRSPLEEIVEADILILGIIQLTTVPYQKGVSGYKSIVGTTRTIPYRGRFTDNLSGLPAKTP
jgi:hypothetical protein